MRVTSPYGMQSPGPTEGVIDEIRRRTGTSLAGEAELVLAGVPGCLEAFWVSVRPAFDRCSIRSAADQARVAAATAAGRALRFPDHVKWLAVRGFSREDSRQIRYVVESFYTLEPVFAVMAALASRWLGGALGSPQGTAKGKCSGLTSYCLGEIEFAAGLARIAPSTPEPILASFEHQFHRALAVWPEYAAVVRETLAERGGEEGYAEAVDELRSALIRSAQDVPLGACELDLDSQRRELARAVEGCIRSSCHVMLAASALRSMFTRVEARACAARSVRDRRQPTDRGSG